MSWIDFDYYDELSDVQSEVLTFINGFFELFAERLTDDIGDPYEPLRLQFRAGYCWHFAHMLKNVFERGEVCWAAPFGHIIWIDIDDSAYDAEGFYVGEAYYCIPESYLSKDDLKDFKKIYGIDKSAYLPGSTKEHLIDIVQKYCKDTGKIYQKDIETCFRDTSSKEMDLF